MKRYFKIILTVLILTVAACCAAAFLACKDEPSKRAVARPEEDATEFVYDGAAKTYALAESADYKLASDSDALTQTDAGEYSVILELTDPDGCKWASDGAGTVDGARLTLPFVVSPKLVEVTAKVGVLDKVYDGTCEVTGISPSSGSSVSGRVDGDTLDIRLDPSRSHFDSADVGDSVPVTVCLVLDGDDKDNYRLEGDCCVQHTAAKISRLQVALEITAPENAECGNVAEPTAQFTRVKYIEIIKKYQYSLPVAGDDVTATFAYTGEDCDGVAYSSTQKPEKAGQYTATASLTGAKAGNYILAGEKTCDFTVSHDSEGWENVTEGDPHLGGGVHSLTCACGKEFEEPCAYSTEYFQPTCEAAGYHIHTCTGCGVTIRHEDEPATGHSYGTPRFSRAEESGGIIKYYHVAVCAHCGDTSEEECDKTAGDVHPATCSEAGYTEYTCSGCGNITHRDLQEKLPHEFGDVEAANDGQWHHKQTCRVCNEVEYFSCTTELQYRYATCEEAGWCTTECTVCKQTKKNYFLGNSLGHLWSEYEYTGTGDGVHDTHRRECLRDGCDKVEEEECDETSIDEVATCLKPQNITTVCSKCQHTHTSQGEEALGHDWGDGWKIDVAGKDGGHIRTCTRCGEKEKDKCVFVEREVKTPTCTAEGSIKYGCNTCANGYTAALDALGHKYPQSADEAAADGLTFEITDTGHRAQCMRCKEIASGDHTYNHTNLCDVCSRDGLEYTLIGAEYAVKSGRSLTSAKKIIIPSHIDGVPVTSIAEAYASGVTKMQAFAQMNNLEEVVLPYTIKSIGNYAFDTCKNLALVTVADEGRESELESIGECAFQNCGKLDHIHIPKTVKYIGKHAFLKCSSLNDLTIVWGEDEHAAGYEMEIGDDAFAETEYFNDRANWTACSHGDGEGAALYLNRHLLRVSTDFKGVFTLKDDTVTVGSGAFADCKSITKLVLNGQIREFSADAFKGCENIGEVVYDGTIDEWLQISFANDAASPTSVDGSRLNIHGATGAVVISEGVKKLPAGIFKGSSITGVSLPASLTYIGEEAFENCENLTEVTAAGTLYYVGADAFTGTPFYRDNIKGGILSLGGCLIAATEEAGETVTLGEDIKSIAARAFYGNETVKNVVIPAAVQYIGAGAFGGCTALTGVDFADKSNWFATSDTHKIGRWPEISTPEEGAASFRFFDGYWRKTGFTVA